MYILANNLAEKKKHTHNILTQLHSAIQLFSQLPIQNFSPVFCITPSTPCNYCSDDSFPTFPSFHHYKIQFPTFSLDIAVNWSNFPFLSSILPTDAFFRYHQYHSIAFSNSFHLVFSHCIYYFIKHTTCHKAYSLPLFAKKYQCQLRKKNNLHFLSHSQQLLDLFLPPQ